MTADAKRMMNCRFLQPAATHRLFCFPWGGGGSNFYAAWGKLLPANIEVYGITLAARESRYKEQPCYSSQETVSQIASTIASEFGDKPFIFFGHSMGSLLSYETAALLKKQHGREPEHMYLSGISPPHSKNRRERSKNFAGMTDEEFKDHLRKLDEEFKDHMRKLGGTPAEVLENDEWMKLFMPALKADYTMVAQIFRISQGGGTPAEVLENDEWMKLFMPALKADYTMVAQIVYDKPEGLPLLSCDFTFFDGDEDSDHDYDSWKELTKGSFSLNTLPGGHFYLKDDTNLQRILDVIQGDFPVAV
ncbi:hypothetical protein ACOMHN_023449 [Nucella lapillus]